MSNHDPINFELTEDEYHTALDYDAEMAYWEQMDSYIEEYANRPECPYCEGSVTTRHGSPYCEGCEVIWPGGWPQLADDRRVNARHDIEVERKREQRGW